MKMDKLKEARLKHMTKMAKLKEKDESKQTTPKQTTQKKKQMESVFENELPTISVTRAPKQSLSRHIKTVLDYLKMVRQEVPMHLLLKEAKIALPPKEQENLLNMLKINPKIRFDPDGANGKGTFAYRSLYQVNNLSEIMNLLSRPEYQDGIQEVDLLDSYNGVEQDLITLKESGRVYVISNKDKKTDVLYYNNPEYQITMDDRLKKIWHELRDALPPPEELEKEMEKAGLTKLQTVEWSSDTLLAKRKQKEMEAKAAKNKPRKKRKIKLTNEHLNEQYDFSVAWSASGAQE